MKNSKILVVDDDNMLGQMLRDMLEFKGYKVTLSKVPEETEKNIIENDIELVLLDKLISGVDGTDVVAGIRKNEKTEKIPVLMMSALHEAKSICIEAGATDFIPKPFEMNQLISTIEGILANSGVE